MKTKHYVLGWLFLLGYFCGNTLPGQETRILGLAREGTLTWTNAQLNTVCHLEWAATPDGPWQASWEELTSILVTNTVMSVQVPVFYRVISVVPEPEINDLTAEQSLALLQAQADNPNFIMLDVRTPVEFNAGHIRNAINLNINAASFSDELDQLDRNRTYLVYCASGNRSGRAVEQMRELGFRRVNNLLGGFSNFANLDGAEPYLVP